MPHNSLEEQEYAGFRQEQTTIIQARYTILGFVIAALSIFTYYILTSSAEIPSSGQPFSIQLLSPYFYGLILLLSMIVTLLLTIHYRSIDAYLWAKYGHQGGLQFQRAYDYFRSSSKFNLAYTSPLVSAYVILFLFALFVSLFINWDIIFSLQSYWLYPLMGIIFLFLITLGFCLLMTKCAGRGLTHKYLVRWLSALDFLPNNPATVTTRAIFLDRDGVINENKEAGVTSLDLFKFIHNAEKALAKLTQQGYSLIVVTNQPYIDDNQMTEQELEAIHQHMKDEIEKAGGYIRKIYTCPHSENQQCSCRKPNTQLFKQAAKELKIDLKNSWAIGDQVSDIKAGNDIGGRTVLVLTGEGEKVQSELANNLEELQPYRIARDLSEAADIIMEEERVDCTTKSS